MSENTRSLRESLIDWLSMLSVSARASFASPLLDEDAVAEAEQHIDPDFREWVRGDPMVTGNSASRYCDDTPGFLTENGLGSREVGASDD